MLALCRVSCAGLALAACNYAVPDAAPPGQAEAVSIIWNEALDAEEPAPSIVWRDGEHCVDGSRWPAIPYGGGCAAGLWSGSIATVVRVPAELGRPLSDSALAHELMHAWLQAKTGSSDNGHARPEWAIVPVLNDALRREGL